MVEHRDDVLDATFAALSNPVRRDLLARLAHGELTVSELARPYRISLAGVSKHLRVLEGAGLIRREIQGRTHLLSLQADAMMDAVRWLAQYQEFWDSSLDALAAMAREEGT